MEQPVTVGALAMQLFEEFAAGGEGGAQRLG
jgi:hypothetical protein